MSAEGTSHQPTEGAQRLSIEQLRQWEELEYGLFLHFGMSTYEGYPPRQVSPSTAFAPGKLDVAQWISVARDAGMRYVVLTAKHVTGHCLWPSRQTDYGVATSGCKVDVLEAFVNECTRRGLKPGFYYCSWDNHHTFGSVTPSQTPLASAFTTAAYRDFQLAQTQELLTQYGPLVEVWIDIPGVLGHEGRRAQYDQIARLQPQTVVLMNSGDHEGQKIFYDYQWPTDAATIERGLPVWYKGYQPWHRIAAAPAEERDYYIPAEMCDTIGYEWFWTEDDRPRSDGELLAMRLMCRARGVNFLLNASPDRHGVIPQNYIDALMRLRKNYEKIYGDG